MRYLFALACVFALWLGFTWMQDATPKAEEGITRQMSLGAPTEVHATSDKEAQVILNDPNMNKNWGLQPGLQTDIKATHAWSITQGSRDITIAIIDTGIDSNHIDLKKNLWVNKGEIPNNGVDDDKNGFVDDVHGWNFVANNNQLTDNHGHGTHVAGIAGAEGGNGVGISGVAPRVSLMILKYYDPKSGGQDNLRNTIRAIQYAVKMKANIINYSGGGLDYSPDEYEAVKMAQKQGILFIAAAGNEKSNSDFQPYYPANYPLDNIVSVTAINPLGKVLQSSNFGEKSVHIAAPGESIYSTLPGDKYGVMTGTSQATAFVSGVAALILANNSEFDYHQVRRQILNTADQSQDLFGKSQTAGILNSWAALAVQPAIPASGAVLAQQSTTSLETNAPRPLTQQLSGLIEALRVPAQKN